MLAVLATLVERHARVILVVAAIAVGAGAVYGIGAPRALSPAGYEVSGSDSTEAARVLADTFDTGPANLVLLVTASEGMTVDDPDVVTAGRAAAAELAAVDDVVDVVSYWDGPIPALRSDNGEQALVTARIVADESTVYDRTEEVIARLAGPRGAVTVGVGGPAASNLDVVVESERDLIRAELIAIPLTAIVLLFVFRSVVAALLPLLVAAIAVVGTAVVLRALSEVTLVSIFALNLTTALGVGMGVDYSLFLVSRWREERRGGASSPAALHTALAVAGRSILFSGLTTAVTIAALLVFNYPLLRSLAVAGLVVVLLATVAALVALPAAIAMLGDNVDRWTLPGGTRTPGADGWWARLARRVMRRPLMVGLATTALLLALGTPFLRADFGLPDDRVLPSAAPSRIVADEIRAGFDGSEFGTIAVVPTAASADPESDVAYAEWLSSLDGVGRVETATGAYSDGNQVNVAIDADRYLAGDRAWFSVVPSVEPISPQAEAIVAAIRADADADADAGAVLVGGEAARLVDNKAEIGAKVPLVLGWMVIAVGVLLFAAFGSVVLPIKAVLLNALSLTASFGAIVWIFQDGRLTWLLGYTPTGLTDVQTPILMLCIAFGLSMDYEVFLLSRITEEWRRSGDVQRAVAVGLQRSGRLITAAALLMAIVFLSFATGGVTFIQMVGIGLALAILVDALVVRALLVPAVMVLAGRWNWWAPRLRSAGVRSVPPPSTAAESLTPATRTDPA
ncbi:MAG: MMPL family transporter [Actinomycetota bacterium]